MRLVLDAERKLFTMTELCKRYGISRMTGHKWLGRVPAGQDGVVGLEDRCRAPLHCPHRTDPEVVEVLVEARHQHPYWGAHKLILWLARRQPGLKLPAASTAGDILKRVGLVRDRRPRRPLSIPAGPSPRPARFRQNKPISKD
jgi:putative transposase